MERQYNLLGLGVLTVSQVLCPRSSLTLETAFHFIHVFPFLTAHNLHQSTCFSSTLQLPFVQRIYYIAHLYFHTKVISFRSYTGFIIPEKNLFKSFCSKFTTTGEKNVFPQEAILSQTPSVLNFSSPCAYRLGKCCLTLSAYKDEN